MSRKCITCGEEINPKRLEILPHTQTCTQHSTIEKKAAITVQMGEGDHTWTETFAVEREEYRQLEEMRNNLRKASMPGAKPEVDLHYEEEDLKEWEETLLDGLDDDDETLWDEIEKLSEEGYTEDED
jgi:hypothetical protein